MKLNNIIKFVSHNMDEYSFGINRAIKIHILNIVIALKQ